MIPARNSRLPGSAAEAKAVIAHTTEKVTIAVNNVTDTDATNVYAPAVKGGANNVWIANKPYLGTNSSIYVMLLDAAGEMSGAPLEINMNNDTTDAGKSYISKFAVGDQFVMFGKSGLPMSLADYPAPTSAAQCAVLDDQTRYYVDIASATANWSTAWGAIADFTRAITVDGTAAGATTDVTYGATWGDVAGGKTPYPFLLPPSGGTGEPKAFLEGSQFVYKLNVPSVLFGDVVMVDYYVEHKHDAVQVDILPDKFAPFVIVEGTSLVRRASDGIDLPITFTIPKFKITTALSFTLSGTGDASSFDFAGEAFVDYSRFDPTKKVLVEMQILNADDNYDAGAESGEVADPTSYRRFQYDEDSEGAYLWKDPSMPAHGNIDYSDTGDYVPTHGGPTTKTPGIGSIDA